MSFSFFRIESEKFLTYELGIWWPRAQAANFYSVHFHKRASFHQNRPAICAAARSFYISTNEHFVKIVLLFAARCYIKYVSIYRIFRTSNNVVF